MKQSDEFVAPGEDLKRSNKPKFAAHTEQLKSIKDRLANLLDSR